MKVKLLPSSLYNMQIQTNNLSLVSKCKCLKHLFYIQIIIKMLA